MAKCAKYCPITLGIIALSESNAAISNQAEPVTLTTAVQMIKQIDPCFVSCHDLHGTHIDVQPCHYEWLVQLEAYFISLKYRQIRG